MEALYGFEEVDGGSWGGSRFIKDHGGRALEFSRLVRPSELGPYVELLNEIWGFGPGETLPLHEAVVTVNTGGLFLGVTVSGERAGLVYVMPAFSREWGYHHHSNFMGYRREFRSLGIGLEAKRVHAILARREGVKLVTWTFDPLQAANGNLNFRKLGCICRTYLEDLYGGMGGSFDPGLPTDRFLVEWRLDSARVEDRLEGRFPPADEVRGRYASDPVIGAAGEELDSGAARIKLAIPAGVHEQAARDLAGAGERLRSFGVLARGLFARGYRVEDMMPSMDVPSGDEQYYVLIKE